MIEQTIEGVVKSTATQILPILPQHTLGPSVLLMHVLYMPTGRKTAKGEFRSIGARTKGTRTSYE